MVDEGTKLRVVEECRLGNTGLSENDQIVVKEQLQTSAGEVTSYKLSVNGRELPEIKSDALMDLIHQGKVKG